MNQQRENANGGDADARSIFPTYVFRNTNLNDHDSDSDDEHENSFEIRRDEFEAIQSIYPDDVVVHEVITKDKLGEYNVILKPTLQEHAHTFCSIELKIKYRARYPQRSPIFKLVRLQGLSPKEVAKIVEIIKKIKTKNQEDSQGWVYYVATFDNL